MKKLACVFGLFAFVFVICFALGCGGGGGGGSSSSGNDIFKIIATLNQTVSSDKATQIGNLSSDGINFNIAKGSMPNGSSVTIKQYSEDASMARLNENFPSLASFTVVSSLYELSAKDKNSKTLTILEVPSELNIAINEDISSNKLYYAVVKQNGEWTLLPLQENTISSSFRVALTPSKSIKLIVNTLYESLFIASIAKKDSNSSKLTYAENFAISVNNSTQSPQTITASYTQAFDSDVEVNVCLTLKDATTLDKADVFITAFQKGNKTIGVKNSKLTYKDFNFSATDEAGKYKTTFKLSSDLATSKISGNTATYTFFIKAKDVKVSDVPSSLILKASVKASTLFYSPDMQINFEKGPEQPNASIKGDFSASTEADVNQTIVIAFSQKMNTESVEKALSIKTGSKSIEASSLKWNSAKTELTLTLKDLDVNTKHIISISSSALSETGIPLKAFTISFTTKNLFKIKYNGNGNTSGTVPVDTNYYNSGDIIKISTFGTLKKDKYYFLCWNTKADGKGTVYYENDEISISDNITLYAIWKYCEFAGGNGTAENPFLVETAEHLNKVRNYPDKCFKQIADIDLGEWLNARTDVSLYPSEEDSNSTVGWLPIDNFTGTYDGNSKILKNIYINRPKQECVALIANSIGSTIKNINLKAINVSGFRYCSGIVGFEKNIIITNCSVSGNIEGTHDYIGGIVANSENSIIEKCVFKGSINGKSWVGGILGKSIEYTTISHCYSEGTFNGYSDVGGIVGYLYGGGVHNCCSKVIITSEGAAGGIVGLACCSIINCSTFVNITYSSNGSGGIVGNTPINCYIHNCYSCGNIIGRLCGGLVAVLEEVSVENCLSISESLFANNDNNNPGRIYGIDDKTKSHVLNNNYGWTKTNNKNNPNGWSNGKTTTGKNGADVSKSEFWGSSTKKSFWIDKLGWTDFDDNWEFRSGYNLPQLKGLPSVPDPDYLTNAE